MKKLRGVKFSEIRNCEFRWIRKKLFIFSLFLILLIRRGEKNGGFWRIARRDNFPDYRRARVRIERMALIIMLKFN